MLRIRRFEERCVELYSAGQDPRLPAPLHRRGGGRRRARCAALGPDDAVVATYREHGHALRARRARRRDHGRDVRQGRRAAAGGRGGSMHLSTPSTRFYGGNAIVARRPPARRRARAGRQHAGPRRASRPASSATAPSPRASSTSAQPRRALAAAGAVLLREQPLRDGHRARALRVARPTSRSRRASYEMPAWPVDGMDVLAVERRRARRAVDAVRAGGGPHFLELRTYRFRAHSMYDPELYRDKAEVARVEGARPDRRASTRGCAPTAMLDDEDLDGARERGRRRDRRRGRRSPRPAPPEPVEDLTRFVYEPSRAACMTA